MAKIKVTKGELKKQRDALKQFRHYLPTLQLKKQQLQMKILEARRLRSKKQKELDVKIKSMEIWKGLLVDDRLDIQKWITPKNVLTKTLNVAGANVPFFESIEFEERDYDYFVAPFWVDNGIKEIQIVITLSIEIDVVNKQIELLAEELRITTQRVNLFEKVKIPECVENIRRIRIYLGDQMANAVGIGKVAKKKIEAREAILV